MSSAPAPSSALAIGQVLRQLREEFPEVTISKIRFLEAEGLVTPSRAPSGYRKFSEADVERLRFVLRAQRDQYLPLKVIKDQLAALDRGVDPRRGGDRGRSGEADRAQASGPTPGPAAERAEQVAAAAAGDFADPGAFVRSTSSVRLTEEELRETTGLDADTFGELRQFRLLPRPVGGHYGDLAVAICRTVAGLAAYGLEPRHLRAFQLAADREIGLFEQVLTPLRRAGDPEAADRALHTLAALSVRLHALLVKSGLEG